MPALNYRECLNALMAEEVRGYSIKYYPYIRSPGPYPYNLGMYVGNDWCLANFPITYTSFTVLSKLIDFSSLEIGTTYVSNGRYSKAYELEVVQRTLKEKWEEWSHFPVKYSLQLTPFLWQGDMRHQHRILHVLDADGLPLPTFEKEALRTVPIERIDWLTHDLPTLRSYRLEALDCELFEYRWSNTAGDLIRVSELYRSHPPCVLGFFAPGPAPTEMPTVPLHVPLFPSRFTPESGMTQPSLLE